MTKKSFDQKLKQLQKEHEKLLRRRNRPQKNGNGIFNRYEFPVLTAEQRPLFWRYDFDPRTNPHLMTRLGINCVFNVGAMEWNGNIVLMTRTEGWDRKSFFAVAESRNGVDGFRYWDYPVRMPENEPQETNLYDMRLVRHEDGWIYGLFCAERHDDSKPGDLSAAVARCGIARTKDLVKWERLPDLKTSSLHQRNCVLHPEFVKGKYAFYTRPMADFAATGSGDGIGWGLCADIEPRGSGEGKHHRSAVLSHAQGREKRPRSGADQDEGGLAASGARGSQHRRRHALRSLPVPVRSEEPGQAVIKAPGGYFLAPEGEERVGDVSNVVFANGWVRASEWRRVHLLRFFGHAHACGDDDGGEIVGLRDQHTEDGMRSKVCVDQRCRLIEKNLRLAR